MIPDVFMWDGKTLSKDCNSISLVSVILPVFLSHNKLRMLLSWKCSGFLFIFKCFSFPLFPPYLAILMFRIFFLWTDLTLIVLNLNTIFLFCPSGHGILSFHSSTLHDQRLLPYP